MEKNQKSIRSRLKLDRLVFDKIEFKRLGFANENEVEFRLESNIAQHKEGGIFKVTLILYGEKKDEYTFEISLTGFFTLELEEDISEELRENLISRNTLAILMPYLRSEVSLLTAQPGMDCVVLPVFNINNMIGSAKQSGDGK